MKKLAAVLMILMVLACSVIFAETSELVITLTIEAVPPTFKLYGSLSNVAASSDASMVAGQTVTTPETAPNTSLTLTTNSLLESDVYVYCVIKQTNAAKYTGTANVTVTATDIEDTNGTTSTATVSALTALNNNDGRTVTGSAGAATIAYTGTTSNSADVASFNVKYAQADLMPGNYTSYITMSFDAP